MTLASSEELQDYQSSGLALSEVQLEDIEGICGDFLEPSTLASTENKQQKTYEDDLDFQPRLTPVSRALNEPVLATQDLSDALDEVGIFEPTQEDPPSELSLTQSTGKKKVKEAKIQHDLVKRLLLTGCNTYPILGEIALELLAISASSACVERVFSISGGIATSARPRLSPQTISRLICVRNWTENKKVTLKLAYGPIEWTNRRLDWSTAFKVSTVSALYETRLILVSQTTPACMKESKVRLFGNTITRRSRIYNSGYVCGVAKCDSSHSCIPA
ncbi:hypothetical protein CROQUDRAFT_94047 [Cronartium quercuum f. sp. fusiforme G11]|uniref:HAT C-terminal dimerisation domain-containing protein n=1 Tax=Cronartium quercuum f. sp. fusiforme G11 TaxID=708437 RepID=A0A9P6TAK2_9BASI|nr:hypothetical protein CROQUDRAFT_94047 [Cronartium quercuum f. sp. fusiforme G11]